MDLLIKKICCGKSSFIMEQGPCLVEVTFSPTIRVLDFIASEESKDGGQCHFLAKNTSFSLTMICNNCK
jgi:hypothetical protein